MKPPTQETTTTSETPTPQTKPNGEGKLPVGERIAAAAATVDHASLLAQLNAMSRVQQEERELVKELAEIDREMKEVDEGIDGKKGEYKALETKRERTIGELRQMILGQRQPQLPFPPPMGTNGGDKKPVATAAAAQAKEDAEAWRSVKLADVWKELGHTKRREQKLLAALKDGKVKGSNDVANVETLGQLADFSNRRDRNVRDIDGIGPKGEELIEEITGAWYGKHPQPKPAEPDKSVTAAAAPGGPPKVAVPNSRGVYSAADLEHIDIADIEAFKADVWLGVALCEDGKWRGGWQCRVTTSAYEKEARQKDKGFATRELALDQQCIEAGNWLRTVADKPISNTQQSGAEKAIEALAKFRATLKASPEQRPEEKPGETTPAAKDETAAKPGKKRGRPRKAK